MNRDLKDMRRDYTTRQLNKEDVSTVSPLLTLDEWLNDAVKVEEEANAMILSTNGRDGYPDARTVLLKEIVDGSLIFYTNYNSEKAKQIAKDNRCNLLFLWLKNERQVRIKGTIAKIPKEQSYTYFKSRPLESQIGAWASPQSQIISNREELLQKVVTMMQQFENPEDIPLPPHWGGYAVTPSQIEFWQGGANRLHDRIRCSLQEDGQWKMDRLAP